jgi:hypothetical protein
MSRFKIVFFLAFTVFLVHDSYGQRSGKVEVIKDPLIDSLLARRIAINNAGGPTYAGFQVQVYLGPDRQAAYEAQNRFKSLHPGINTYLSYTEPNYKVQVGEFRSRVEAQKMANDLKAYFTRLLIIPATIKPQ